MTDDNPRTATEPRSAQNNHHDGVDDLGPLSEAYATALVPAEPTPAIETVAPTVPLARTSGSGARVVREIIETLLLALVIFAGVRLLVLNFRVDGMSMVPNLHNQEMLLVNRNAYRHFDLNRILNILPWEDRTGEDVHYLFDPPRRGDIIVFNPPLASEKPYIKRVIAVGGDTVEIKEGYVYINGQRLDEPYIKGAITDCNQTVCKPYVVPAGKLFVMGDNRRGSSDSRFFGAIAVDSVIGKAWFTYWPLSDLGLVPHYDYPALPHR